MPAIMPQRTMELSQARTPDKFREMIHATLDTSLMDWRTCGYDVLFATYIDPEVTKGGIILPNRSVQESLYQGSVGLVLQCGPMAFKYDARGYAWEGHSANVDDWILIRFADCMEIHIAGISCRLVDHENIKAIIPSPEMITSDKRTIDIVTSQLGSDARDTVKRYPSVKYE